MLDALRRLLGRKTSRIRIGSDAGDFVILDFREKTIRLPNGDVIHKDDIISFDSASGKLIYRAPDGTIKALDIVSQKQDSTNNLIEEILKQISKNGNRQRSNNILYI